MLSRTVVHERGLKAIWQNDVVNGRAIHDTVDDMVETLRKARTALDTEKGRKIAAAYLGYDTPGELTDIDIKNIKKNIESLEETGKWLQSNEKSVRRVSIHDQKRGNVVAYYSPKKNKIAFNDAFFTKDRTERLQILLHESVHASIKVDGAPVPDYYYLRGTGRPEAEGILPHPTTSRRNEQLGISRGSLRLNYFMGRDGHLLYSNFIKGMEAENITHAAIIFMENPEVRRG
ncbi:hypothetical protein CCS41_03505 [Candidatus Fukatsuia symbiotica]|uniref:Lysine-specific metallo-endopeptidase domain-containing protein n=2 Tax=Yersiniaceae TaxID=1903411 RepID=A0A2U8I763_9GAMM|nr:hypothetical protein CCS41_03505 [Candidatus Fukatsuia symbiotica]